MARVRGKIHSQYFASGAILQESDLATFSKSSVHIPFEPGDILIFGVLLHIWKMTFLRIFVNSLAYDRKILETI